MGSDWQPALGTTTTFDPIRVTVAVGWVQQGRVAGTTAQPNFIYQGERRQSGKMGVTVIPESLTASDTDGNGVIDSQAMLTTLVTCR